MQKVFLVYGESDEDLGSELAVLLRASLPACELVGPWVAAYADDRQGWLTSHAVVGLVTQASLQSAEVPFALGGADALEKPVFAVLSSDVAESTLSTTVPREQTARLNDHSSVAALAEQVANRLGVSVPSTGDGAVLRAAPDPEPEEAPAPAEAMDDPPRAPEEARSEPAPEPERSSGISYTQGWVAESQEAWAYDAEERPGAPRAADPDEVTPLEPRRRRSAQKPTVPGRPTPIAQAQKVPQTTEDVVVQAFREIEEAEEVTGQAQTHEAAHRAGTGQPTTGAPQLTNEPWPAPAGVPTVMVGDGPESFPSSPIEPNDEPTTEIPTQASAVAREGESDVPLRPSDVPLRPSTESAEDTQELWPVAEDATALPDGADAAAPRAIPTRSDVAPAPSVLAAAPGCEASLDAGRAFSDCVFHREQGDALRTELEAPFGHFITALGGNWETLRALDDVDLWMEMADNVLIALPDDKQYVRWWYEVGFQLATLLNLAGVDPDSSVARELDGTWESAMEALTAAVNALGMSAAEVAVLEGMLENLRGPSDERDYLNASRVQAVIKERASHADAALSA